MTLSGAPEGGRKEVMTPESSEKEGLAKTNNDERIWVVASACRHEFSDECRAQGCEIEYMRADVARERIEFYRERERIALESIATLTRERDAADYPRFVCSGCGCSFPHWSDPAPARCLGCDNRVLTARVAHLELALQARDDELARQRRLNGDAHARVAELERSLRFAEDTLKHEQDSLDRTHRIAKGIEAERDALTAQLAEANKYKQGYYNEAAKGWGLFRAAESTIADLTAQNAALREALEALQAVINSPLGVVAPPSVRAIDCLIKGVEDANKRGVWPNHWARWALELRDVSDVKGRAALKVTP